MYQPPAFREDRLDVQHGLIRTHPLGLLITAGPGGLMANPIPFLVAPELSERGTLRAHLARANPQWRELQLVDECLAVFQGPQDYVSPSWYASKREHGKVVPTWNYATVHVWGRPRVIDEAGWLRGQLDELTDLMEAPRPAPWQVGDAPPDFVTAQVKGIVGLEIPVDRIEGKWKMSQNRPMADRESVVTGMRAHGEGARAIADLVAARGDVAEG